MKPTNNAPIKAWARDDRFFRASHHVLKRYELNRLGVFDGHLRFEVKGGHMPYEVSIPLEGAGTHTCTCPDAKNHAPRLTAGFCKHIIACLLRTSDGSIPEGDLSYHLLDLML